MEDLPPLTISRGSRKVLLDHPLVAAPMAGAFDPPFRMVLHEHGVRLSFTEMISARGTYERSRRTGELAGWVPKSGYSAAQIFGARKKYLVHAAREMERIGHHIVDLNTGCPKRKVLVSGGGGAMLKDPEHLLECLSALLDAVGVPVGFKTRSGYHDHDPSSFSRLLKDAEGAGISYVVLHPRTVLQGFKGSAVRNVIDLASKAVDIPVIASGDVRSPEDVKDYLRRGAAGVMIGRALFGDPLLVERILADDDRRYPSSADEVEKLMRTASDQLRRGVSYFGERRGLVKFRTHLSWYVKSFKARGPYMDEVHHISSLEEGEDLIDRIREEWKDGLGSC